MIADITCVCTALTLHAIVEEKYLFCDENHYIGHKCKLKTEYIYK